MPRPIRSTRQRSSGLLILWLIAVIVGTGQTREAKRTDSPVMEDARNAFEAGNRLMDQKAFKKAIRRYDVVLKIDPENSAAYFNRGLAEVHSHGYAKAIEDFNAVLQRDPRAADALFYRGIARKASGDFSGAARDMESAAAIDPAYQELATYGRGTWAKRWLYISVLIVCAVLSLVVGMHLFRLFRMFGGASQ